MTFAFLLALCPLVMLAQEPTGKTETPPDQKAYSAAVAKKDPVEKIAALEKFLVDFPQSSGAGYSRIVILTTIAKEWPGDQSRIEAQIGKIFHATKKASRSSVEQQVASALLEQNVMLEEAERHAAIGVKSFKRAAYIQEQKASAVKRKRPVPSDEELSKRYLAQLAPREETLGLILYKEGRQKQSEKLLKTALAANPTLWEAASRLASIAQRRNEDAAALDYLVTVRLFGHADSAALKRLEQLYEKLHDDSVSLDEYLDSAYHQRFPNPIEAQPYQKTAARTDRAVLAEVFTGSGCPPCVAADLAVDAALERYTRQDVVALMYHQHIPKPDPMANPSTLTRAKFYGVRAVPSYSIDGKLAVGGGPRDYALEFWNKVNPDIEKRLDLAAQDRIALDAKMDGSIVTVKATLDPIESESGDLKLQVALVEETLRYSGENGIRFHPMVVRAMGGPEEAGFALDPDEPAPVEVAFDLDKIAAELKEHLDKYEKDKSITFSEKKDRLDRSKLGIVAFVQDEESKEILQSVFLKVDDAH